MSQRRLFDYQDECRGCGVTIRHCKPLEVEREESLARREHRSPIFGRPHYHRCAECAAKDYAGTLRFRDLPVGPRGMPVEARFQ